MKKIINNLFFLLTLVFVGCASTRMTSFKDPAYQYSTFQRILVVVNASDLERKFYFESQMVDRLIKAGIFALEGYKLFPPTRNLSPTEKVELLNREHIDSYISISVGESGVEQTYIPPTGTTTKTTGSITIIGNSANYEEKSKTEIQRGYTLSKPWAEFETKLFDATTGNTVWIATSFTGGNAFANFNTVINSFCDETFKKLVGDNLIMTKEQPQKDRHPESSKSILKANANSSKEFSFLTQYLYPSDERKKVRITSNKMDVLEVFLIGATSTTYILSNKKEPIDTVSYIKRDKVIKIDEIK